MTAGAYSVELADVLLDAALQARFMRARRHDLEHQAAGRKFIYGVDTNVLRYWGNPRTSSPERLNHPGRIFRNDGNDLVTSIFWGLLTYIFENLVDVGLPLIIIPPMEAEVASTMEALYETESSAASAPVRVQINEVMARLHQAIPAEELSRLTVTLQELLFQELGEHAELNRMTLLFQRQRVKKLDEAARQLPADLRDTLLPTENLTRRWVEYARARRPRQEDGAINPGWDERLRRVGAWRRDELRDNDSKVLARLEVWNGTLARQGSAWRVLYLTADHRLFEAAAGYEGFDGAEGKNFADAYLRHPRAYLSENGVLGVVDDTQGNLSLDTDGESVGEWLRLLTDPIKASFVDLLKSSRADPGLSNLLRAVADDGSFVGAAGSAPALAHKLLDRWRRFAQGALVANPAPAQGLLGLTRDRKQTAQEMLDVLLQAQTKLEVDRRNTLRAYLHVTTRLGQTFEAVQRPSALVRSVPPIYFEAWRDAGRAIALMSHWIDGEMDEDAYQAAVDLLDHDDGSSYAFYLGNAAFFAARNRWRSAVLLARRAFGSAKTLGAEPTIGKPSQGANGREAAYFESVCRARIARDLEELELARAALAISEKVLALEKAEGRYNDFVEERFKAQAAMLDLVAFHLDDGSNPTPLGSADAIRRLADRFWALLEVATERRMSTARWRNEEEPLEPGSADDVRLRAEIGLITTVLRFGFLPETTKIDEARARIALERLESLLANAQICVEDIGSFEYAFIRGARLRTDAMFATKVARRDFKDFVAALQIDDTKLAPYEPYLLEELRKRAEQPWRV